MFTRTATIVLLAAGALLLSACSSPAPTMSEAEQEAVEIMSSAPAVTETPPVERDPATGQFTAQTWVPNESLRPGDCIVHEPTDMSTWASGSQQVEPCTGPNMHEEVTLVGTLDPAIATYSDAATEEDFWRQCDAAFAAWVGVPVEGSVLQATGILPSAESFADGDRNIVCTVVVDPAVTAIPENGSVKGLAV